MGVNKEVKVGQFCLWCSAYNRKTSSLLQVFWQCRERRVLMQQEGCDLKMLQFVLSTSLFHDANTFSLALTAVSKVSIFSRTRYCWGAGGTHCQTKMGIPLWGSWLTKRLRYSTCSCCFSGNWEATRGEMETWTKVFCSTNVFSTQLFRAFLKMTYLSYLWWWFCHLNNL